MGGKKDKKLARYDLIPIRPLFAVATLYGLGASKYDERNWELGYSWSSSYAALQRHANAFWGGESVDPDNGQHHLTSVVFHAFALMEFEHTHPKFDDRGTKVDITSPVTIKESKGGLWRPDPASIAVKP